MQQDIILTLLHMGIWSPPGLGRAARMSYSMSCGLAAAKSVKGGKEAKCAACLDDWTIAATLGMCLNDFLGAPWVVSRSGNYPKHPKKQPQRQ